MAVQHSWIELRSPDAAPLMVKKKERATWERKETSYIKGVPPGPA